MPAEPFSVHLDPADLLRPVLTGAGAVEVPSPDGPDKDRPDKDRPSPAAIARHGTGDDRLAARRRSERDRSGRAAGAAGGRSYAFRRS